MPGRAPDAATRAHRDAETVRVAAEAYVWAYPILLGYRELRTQTRVDGAEFATFRHDTHPPTPGDGSGPWADPGLLRSSAWLDLRAGPVVLSHPELPTDAYVGLQVVDLFARTVGNVGVVATGPEASAWAITGPDWDGPAPAGLRGTLRAESDVVRVLVRTAVPTPRDLAGARALQQEYRLRPAAAPGGVPSPRPAAPLDWLAWDEDRAWGPGFVDYLELLLRAHRPTGASDRALLDRCERLGILTDPRVGRTDTRTRALVGRGAALGAAQLRDAVERDGNGVPALDPLDRAVAASVELHPPDPREIRTLRWRRVDGDHLRGQRQYRLTFVHDRLPPARLSWSLATYAEPTGELVANPARRYTVGPRTPGLTWAPDGSLTIAVQHDEPTDPRMRTNWLPAPQGPFSLVARLYAPDSDRRGWTPPPLRIIG